MRLPSPDLTLAALRDPRRWRRWAIEALILAAIVGVITVWQNRDLPEGAAPPLAGFRTDGTAVKLGAGGAAASGQAAQLVVLFWATWCPVCTAEAGNIRFRVVGYATEWGLRLRLWWAQNVA